MTQTLSTQPTRYEAAHEKLLARVGSAGPIDTLRRDAMAAFAQQGFPTTRHEDWRFTRLKALDNVTFALPEGAAEVSADQAAAFDIPDLDAARLVFVDGHFNPTLSQAMPTGQGFTVSRLADALADADGVASRRIGDLLDIRDDAFGAMNTAFIEDGLFVHVAAGKSIDKPIHVLCITTDTDGPIMTHPRCLVVADAGASATVIEHYVSIGDGVHLTNAVTEIIAGDDAVVHHYFIERENAAAINVSTLKITQGQNSDVRSHTALLGGKLVRNNVHPILAGDDAHCLINGLYIGRDDQHLDNHMRVEHAALRGDSRQFYKGILDDHSRGVFAGRIVVHPGAQQTDAKQTNRNMLLSDEARVNAKPQLEIYADDVKCTHGATTGQVDEDMVFYLRSRGIDAKTARALMIFAFAAETFERIDLAPVEQLFKRELLKRLPEANVLADVL